VATPPSRRPRSSDGEGEVLGVVPLLRAEGGEEESQFGLVVPEDIRATEAEAGLATHRAFLLHIGPATHRVPATHRASCYTSVCLLATHWAFLHWAPLHLGRSFTSND